MTWRSSWKNTHYPHLCGWLWSSQVSWICALLRIDLMHFLVEATVRCRSAIWPSIAGLSSPMISVMQLQRTEIEGQLLCSDRDAMYLPDGRLSELHWTFCRSNVSMEHPPFIDDFPHIFVSQSISHFLYAQCNVQEYVLASSEKLSSPEVVGYDFNQGPRVVARCCWETGWCTPTTFFWRRYPKFSDPEYILYNTIYIYIYIFTYIYIYIYSPQ